MIHLPYLSDDDLENVFPTLNEEEFKNYAVESNFVQEISEIFNVNENKADANNSPFGNQPNLRMNDLSISTETCLSKTEGKIDLNFLFPEEASFFRANRRLESLDKNFFNQKAIEELTLSEEKEEGKERENDAALAISPSRSKDCDELYFPMQTANRNNSSRSKIKSNENLREKNVEENKKIKIQNYFNCFALLKLNDFSTGNDKKINLSSGIPNVKATNSAENKSKNLLRNKTNRSEALIPKRTSKVNTKKPKADKTHFILNNSKTKQDFQSDRIPEEKNEINNGRWSNPEHKRFIDALIKHGKKWQQIKWYIKTRNYFQIVQYTTRFFKRIKRALDIKANISYDSMSCLKKLIKQKQIKRFNNEISNYHFEFKNCKEQNEIKFNLNNLFFEFISGINTTNFNKFCVHYRSIISNDIKSYFIKEFLVLNPIKIQNFRTFKVDLIRENDKNSNQTGISESSDDFKPADYEDTTKAHGSKNSIDICNNKIIKSFIMCDL